MIRGSGLTVTRTKPISPSKIGTYKKCALRYLFETERGAVPSLPTGPFAMRGIATHKVIEKFIGKPAPDGGKIKETMVQHLEALATGPDASPLIKFIFGMHGLDGLISRAHVLDACQFVKKMIGQFVRNQNALANGAPAKVANEPYSALGPEKWFEEPELDLAGKIDFTFSPAPGVVHVVDFKTGNLLDEETGIPKEDFLLQVVAYGLLVRGALKVDNIVLRLVGPSSSWAAPLEAPQIAQVLPLINRLAHHLPKGRPLCAEDLANPGLHCHTCAYRPACKKYYSQLNGEGLREGDSALSPFDVSGNIVSAQTNGELTEIRSKTRSGSGCWITGIPTSICPPLVEGAMIQAYGLRSLEKGRAINRPSNFFLYRADDPRASAFSSFVQVCPH